MAVGIGVGVGGADVAVACAGAVGLGEALTGVEVGAAPVVAVAAVAAGAMGVSVNGALNEGVTIGGALGAPPGAGWPDDGVRKRDGQSQLSARMTTSARLAQKSVTPGSALGGEPGSAVRGVSGAALGAESGRLMRSSLLMSRERDETGCVGAARRARGETRQGQAACAPVCRSVGALSSVGRRDGWRDFSCSGWLDKRCGVA